MTANKPAPWAAWFNGRESVRTLPPDCVRACSASGAVDAAVAHWVKALDLQAPPWLLREHLKGYGAWARSQLCDHNENLQRLLWIWACDIAEDPESYEYAYLGN